MRRARAAGAGGVFARGGIGKRLKRRLPLFTALIGVAWGAGGVCVLGHVYYMHIAVS